jgi:chromosome segregation ATPase
MRSLREAVDGWVEDNSPREEAELQRLRDHLADTRARLDDQDRLVAEATAPTLAALEAQIERLDRIFRHVMDLRERVEAQEREKTPEYKELMQMASDWEKDQIKATARAKRKAAALIKNSKRPGRRPPSSPGLQ